MSEELSEQERRLDLLLRIAEPIEVVDTELMQAFGKHLIDEGSDIKLSFMIPNQTQKSIEDY